MAMTVLSRSKNAALGPTAGKCSRRRLAGGPTTCADTGEAIALGGVMSTVCADRRVLALDVRKWLRHA